MTYQEFKEAVILAAKEQNVTEYELYYSSEQTLQMRSYKEDIDSFSSSESGGVCFRCIVNGKAGYAATELFTKEAAEKLVGAAAANAGSIETEDPVLLKEAGDTYPEAHDTNQPELSAACLKELTLKTQKQLMQENDKVTDASQVMTIYEKNERAIMNSKGLDLVHTGHMGVLYASAVLEDQGEMYEGDQFILDASGMQDIDYEKLASGVVDTAFSKIGAEVAESGKYTCVFSGKVMASLLQTFGSVFSLETAQKGLSLLKGKEGSQIASEVLTLTDDPFLEGSCMQYPFDAEGTATYKKNVIENGQFMTFLSNLTTAAKENQNSTGNAGREGYASPIGIAPTNFYVQPGSLSFDKLLEQVGEGLYITDLNGLHAGANPLTGDFSLAADGYRIRDGKKMGAVHHITVSDNFYGLLKKIRAVADTLEFGFPSGQSLYASPAVSIQDLSIAGK